MKKLLLFVLCTVSLSSFGLKIAHGLTELIDSKINPLVNPFPWKGVAVGVLTPKEESYFNYGVKDILRPAITKDTIFGINSMTKIFTASILAEMVIENKLSLEDYIQPYLSMHPMPKDGVRQIRFLDLATHYSGLPKSPTNFPHPESSDPYTDYTDDLFFDFLKNYKYADSNHIGSQYLYSNIAFGLLGYVLGHIDNRSFEQMIRGRITEPLELRHTVINSASLINPSITIGHDMDGKVVVAGTTPESILGSWAVRSTAKDIVKFLKANLIDDHSILSKAFMLTHLPRFNTEEEGFQIGLGWKIETSTNTHVKTGGGDGFKSIMLFNRTRGTALVILSNTDDDSNHGIGKAAWEIFNAISME